MIKILRPGAFRLFLAFTVLVSHSSRFDLGLWAVLTFFVLSGYWIHRMWTLKYSRTRAPYAVFIASRLMRLLPVFWVGVVLSTIALAIVHRNYPGPTWSWPAAVASNVLVLGYANLPFSQGGLRVAWTLDVEMQFYVLFPLAMYLCTRTRAGFPFLLLIGATCVAGAVAFMIPEQLGTRYLGCFGPFFMIGILCAHQDWRFSERTVNLLVFFVALLLAACCVTPILPHLLENDKHGATAADLHYKLIFEFMLALLTAPIALYTVRNPSGPADRAMGEFTYVLYLIHWPIMMVHARYFEHLPPLQRLPSIIGAWILVAAASWAVFRYLDQPLERRRKRWVASQLPA